MLKIASSCLEMVCNIVFLLIAFGGIAICCQFVDCCSLTYCGNILSDTSSIPNYFKNNMFANVRIPNLESVGTCAFQTFETLNILDF